jgi:hypothetical protein
MEASQVMLAQRGRQVLRECRRADHGAGPINGASNAPPESPVSFAPGDVVPHVVIQSLHLRVVEFESHLAKRLLQQHRHFSDLWRCPTCVQSALKCGHRQVGGQTLLFWSHQES